ncbi:MAG: hypothetical protein JXA67_18605 [Micromonosporaceae bacterium]|nr:hypothetical protein [Micromonosporaceae bacterium]
MPPRNPNFTGREELLDRLHATLPEQRSSVLPQTPPEQRSSVLPQTLHGFGGVGKTQLATEYAYRFRNHYDLVWWISANRATDALASIVALGEKLGVVAGGDRRRAASEVLSHLAESSDRWLLIYDDIERPEDIGPLVPSEGGHIILTSRKPDWISRQKAVEVEVFTRAESIDFLGKRSPNMSPEAMDRIAEKIGDLPLGLEQAANFQKATAMSPDEYLALHDKRLSDAPSCGRLCECPSATAVTVALAIETLGCRDQAAAELLELFAHLGPAPVTIRLLRQGRTADLSPLLSGTLRNRNELRRVIDLLARYGLAEFDVERQWIRVHRLVQTVLRRELSDERSVRSQRNVRRLLAMAVSGKRNGQIDLRGHAELGPHIMPADLIHSDSDHDRSVALRHAEYLLSVGDNDECRRFTKAMVDTWKTPSRAAEDGREHEQLRLARKYHDAALRKLMASGQEVSSPAIAGPLEVVAEECAPASSGPAESPKAGARTTVPGQLYGGCLGRPQVCQLFEAIRDPFRPDEVRVCAIRKDTEYTDSTPNHLNEKIRRSAGPGDLDVIHSLRIEASNAQSSVVLALRSCGVEFTVAGDDRVWARGMVECIREHLTDAGCQAKPVRSGRWHFAGVGTALSSVLGAALLGTGFVQIDAASLCTVGVLILSAFFGGYSCGRERERRAETRFSIAGPVTYSNWWTEMSVPGRTGMVLSILSFVSVLVRLFVLG